MKVTVSPGTELPFASRMSTQNETVWSEVIVEAIGPAIKVTGVPGCTMMMWSTMTRPNRAEIVTFPLWSGVNSPELDIVPSVVVHSTVPVIMFESTSTRVALNCTGVSAMVTDGPLTVMSTTRV